jgi:hypothetical protein
MERIISVSLLGAFSAQELGCQLVLLPILEYMPMPFNLLRVASFCERELLGISQLPIMGFLQVKKYSTRHMMAIKSEISWTGTQSPMLPWFSSLQPIAVAFPMRHIPKLSHQNG